MSRRIVFSYLLSQVVIFLVCQPILVGMAQQNKPALITQTGHTGEIISVALNYDGALMATGAEDATIKLWHVGSRRVLRTIQAHASPVMSLAFRPNSEELASVGAWDSAVRLWNLRTGAYRELKGPEVTYGNLAFSPDGMLLVHGGPFGLSAFDMKTGERHVLGSSRVDALSFSPDGKVFATASEDGKINIWGSRAGNPLNWLKTQPRSRSYKGGLYALAFAPLNKWLVTAGATIDVWDVQSGAHVRTLGARVVSVKRPLAISPDGKLLAAAGNGDSHTNGRARRAFGSPRVENSTITLWKVGTWERVDDITNHPDAINALTFSPKEGLLISGSRDSSIRFWDTKRQAESDIPILNVKPVTSISFTPDDKSIASGVGNEVVLWDLNRGNPSLILKGHGGKVRSVTVSPSGKIIASRLPP